jgi:hypothetical protein
MELSRAYGASGYGSRTSPPPYQAYQQIINNHYYAHFPEFHGPEGMFVMGQIPRPRSR